MRNVLAKLMTAEGFCVLVSASAESALGVAELHDDRIDTALVMPGRVGHRRLLGANQRADAINEPWWYMWMRGVVWRFGMTKAWRTWPVATATVGMVVGLCACGGTESDENTFDSGASGGSGGGGTGGAPSGDASLVPDGSSGSGGGIGGAPSGDASLVPDGSSGSGGGVLLDSSLGDGHGDDVASSSDFIVVDGFESGDWSAPGYPDFEWSVGSQVTHVVTMTAAGNPKYLYTAEPRDDELVGDPRDWTAKSGDNSMMIDYSPGSSWAEKNFTILADGVTDLWISWWMRIPTNFFHDGTNYGSNNKLLRVWEVDYQNPFNEKGGMEFRAADSQWDQVTGHSYFYMNPGSGSGWGNSPTFCKVPDDRGRWMHIIFNIRCESSPGAQDGVRRVWRKWENEAEHTLLVDWQNQDVVDAGGFKYGYFMGYANATYAEQTEFLFDDIVFSATPLI